MTVSGIMNVAPITVIIHTIKYEYIEIQNMAIRKVNTKEFAHASFRQSGIVKDDRVYSGNVTAHLIFAHFPADGSGLDVGSSNLWVSSSFCFFIPISIFSICTSPLIPLDTSPPPPEPAAIFPCTFLYVAP